MTHRYYYMIAFGRDLPRVLLMLIRAWKTLQSMIRNGTVRTVILGRQFITLCNGLLLCIQERLTEDLSVIVSVRRVSSVSVRVCGVA